MAGHIQDRWYKTEPDAAGKPRRVRTDRYGTGMRYRARYIGPDGTEKSKSFPDGQKRLADQWLAHIEADMSRGQYVDPAASRVTFRQYAEKWRFAVTLCPTWGRGLSARSSRSTSGIGSASWNGPSLRRHTGA